MDVLKWKMNSREKHHKEIQNHRKKTLNEENITWRHPNIKRNSQEDDLTGRKPQRNKISKEYNVTERRPHSQTISEEDKTWTTNKGRGGGIFPKFYHVIRYDGFPSGAGQTWKWFLPSWYPKLYVKTIPSKYGRFYQIVCSRGAKALVAW